MLRPLALTAALAVSLLCVSGAGGSPAQAPKRGGTIVLLRLATTEPACLNPFACNAGFSFDPSVMQVLEGAYEVDSDLVARPNLVSRVTIGRQPFTLTYHIRPNARWSDDVPVTASDFWFTQRVFARQPMVAGRFAMDLHRNIRRARVLDAKTYRVELREPFARWRELYPVVLPRHALEGRDPSRVWIDRIDNPATGAPIGSGPFLVSRWDRGSQLVLVRNPRYWGPHTAYLDRLVHRFVRSDPTDPLGPIRRNEFDVALALGGGFVSQEVAAQVRQTPGWRVLTWPTLAVEHLAFRMGEGGHPALRSKLVRRALAFGIDRVAITRAIQAEIDRTARKPLDSTVFMPSEQFYEPNWSAYRYSPARARRLLEQAGCRRGADGVYQCAGERLRLRLATTPDPVRSQVLRLVQAHLRPAGVEIEPVFVVPAPFFQQLLPSGDYDIALFAWLPSPLGNVWPEALCGNVQNWAGFCSRLVMRDAQQVDLIVDPRRRARMLNAVDLKLVQAVPVLPIVQPVLRAAVRDTVRGVEPGGTQFHFSQNSEDWWLDR